MDWYAEEMVDRQYVRCNFSDVDLTEATSQRARFEECQFFNVRFNASRHTDSAFLRCAFRRCNLFERSSAAASSSVAPSTNRTCDR
jgi:uncharacterized protein YjbI with pentapeptide repeats